MKPNVSRVVQACFALVLVVLAACDDNTVEPSSGVRAQVLVHGGQFQEGSFPADLSPDASSGQQPMTLADGAVVGPPRVLTVQTANSSLEPGASSKSARLVVSNSARTVAIGVDNDSGYWIVPVQFPSIEFEQAFELMVNMDFSSSVEPGPLKLWVAAIDADGRVGPPYATTLQVKPKNPSGALVVELSWTENADLDLLVVQPDGVTLTNKSTATAGTGDTRGTIDIDSNANCVIDGHRAESAVYSAFGPGEYKVYVREAAACGVPLTGWTVRVFRDGNELTRAQGAAYAYEVDLPNGGPSGPGRFALSFNIGG